MKRKLSFFSILFTFFVDNLSWSIVFPIFAPYFLGDDSPLFESGVSEEVKTLLLGLCLAAFSLGQFMGAPILGEYADRHGRRKALLVSLFFTALSLALSAWSVDHHKLGLLFLGRTLSGVFAGNMTICFAAISDLSEGSGKKANYFSYLSVTVGLAFLIGAFVGGNLSTSLSLFSIPIWMACGLTLFALIFVFFGFQETSQIDPTIRLDIWESWKQIFEALRMESLRKVYLIYFLFLFSWTIFLQYAPVLFVQTFDFNPSSIGNLALYMGCIWGLGSGLCNRFLIRYFAPLNVLKGALFALTFFSFLFLLFPPLTMRLILLGGVVLTSSLAWPLCSSRISDQVSNQMQGKVLGMSQSIQSLSMALAPCLAALANTFSLEGSFWVAAGTNMTALIVFLLAKFR